MHPNLLHWVCKLWCCIKCSLKHLPEATSFPKVTSLYHSDTPSDILRTPWWRRRDSQIMSDSRHPSKKWNLGCAMQGLRYMQAKTCALKGRRHQQGVAELPMIWLVVPAQKQQIGSPFAKFCFAVIGCWDTLDCFCLPSISVDPWNCFTCILQDIKLFPRPGMNSHEFTNTWIGRIWVKIFVDLCSFWQDFGQADTFASP